MLRADSSPDAAAGPAGTPRVGDVIAAKYRVEKVLGMGGMGIVLAVRHMQLGEMAALKCLLPASAADPETVERFMREAKAAVRIKSEHIARVSDVGLLENGSPYMLMEHLTGRDLSDVLSESGPLAIGDAVEYVLQACTGIAEAHALGIVHRDLKPANLFLTQRLDGPSLVKVLDFGISKAMGEAGQHNPSLTQTTSVFGSPAYMSPEQIRSAKNVDFRTDVWALGVILYELLTGELPFKAETSAGLLAAISADEPQRLRDRRLDVPEALEVVVMRSLEKRVTKRFQSVSELADALEPFASATSLVSVGRIRRLSTVPASDPSLQASTGPSSSPRLHADAYGLTERAWTARTLGNAKRGRALTVVSATAIVLALAVGGLLAARLVGPRAAPPTIAASPPKAPADESATSTPPASARALAAPAASNSSAASSPKPTAATVAASSATPKQGAGARGARPANAKPSPMSPATGASQAGPVAPPATPGPAAVPRDPTLDSH